ncbi:hypothetical protein [Flavobacterium defluvii]|uniref:Uncharacterized protein n=1 Tax=Flavobacterium defluvii TaxID=370979 RepID=A0A1M5IY14_9FLAO|nr:hypothetical protein [Flavobacterium defluvii]SHG33186.1 hypothetical protein SAMN05443663_102547 [Flavobacterium defluvii]
MINPVTPWTAAAQSDIQNSKLLYKLSLQQYKLQILNAGDSLWLTVENPQAGTTAFRLAFGINGIFGKTSVTRTQKGLEIKASTRLGNYTITVTFPKSRHTIFRYTTVFTASFPFLIPFWPRDIVQLTKTGRIENTIGTVHVKQTGARSGHLFFSMNKPSNGSVFYFQNLTAMSAYCDATKTSLSETVGGEWPEIGFQFPVNPDIPVPEGIPYTISDAFVILEEKVLEKATELSAAFLDFLSEIYLLLPKPEPQYQDWLAIAQQALNSLYLNKGCWTVINGTPYLNAYAGDYDTPAEIMVQLAVLLPLQEYLIWSQQTHPVYDDLSRGITDFYDDRVKSIVRWHPARENQLDKSEEQKKEMVMDSWYLHHPLLNLARLALRGDKTAERLFLDSIDYAIKVARHFDYNWPVFYKMTTLEVIKAETSPGNGGEKDVPGSYAHIMFLAYKLTGEKRFFTEAAKAVKHLEGLGFHIFYQANNTAFTAGALAEMYRETQDEKYLSLSYSCLAGIFKNVQLWDCGYGYGKNFPNFFSVFPLNDAPYTAAYEEFEVFAALHHYMEVTDGLPILPSLKILLPEFIKYAASRLAYYYPPLLPEDIIDKEIKTGEIQKELWIPLEDLHDGWEKSGGVGQEVYGAGLPFGIIPRQYFKIEPLKGTAYINYPIAKLRLGKKALTFHITGDNRFKASLEFIGISKTDLKKIKVEQKNTAKYAELKTNTSGRYELDAGSSVRISWT